MKTILAVLAILLAATGQATAQPAPGPAPTLRVVSSTTPDKGLLAFFVHEPRTEQFPVRQPVREIVEIDGKKVLVTKVQTRVVYVSVAVTMSIANSRVITPDGKQLPIDEVWKRLKPNTVFAVSGDANPPAPAFLRALQADTLVIIPGPPEKIPPPK